MNCSDSNGNAFYFPQHSKRLVLGSAFLVLNRGHFNQLQLRSMDNRGNCSSQHSEPIPYFGSCCVSLWRWGHLSIVSPPLLPQSPSLWASKPRCERKSAPTGTGTCCKVAPSTKARNLNEELSTLWFCCSLTTSTGLFQYTQTHKVTTFSGFPSEVSF